VRTSACRPGSAPLDSSRTQDPCWRDKSVLSVDSPGTSSSVPDRPPRRTSTSICSRATLGC
jgi:hypothetical protein